MNALDKKRYALPYSTLLRPEAESLGEKGMIIRLLPLVCPHKIGPDRHMEPRCRVALNRKKIHSDSKKIAFNRENRCFSLPLTIRILLPLTLGIYPLRRTAPSL
jgi:hypothetical protein